MTESYSNHNDNEIARGIVNNQTLSTKVETLNQLESLNNNQNNPIKTQINNTNEVEKDEDMRGIYIGERKKILDYKIQIKDLKNKIKFLQNDNKKKDIEIKNLKEEIASDNEYLKNLEKLLIKEREKQNEYILAQKRLNTGTLSQKYSINQTQTNQYEIEKEIEYDPQTKELLDELSKLKEFRDRIIENSFENCEVNFELFDTLKRVDQFIFNLEKSSNDLNIKRNAIKFKLNYNNNEEIEEHYNNLINNIMSNIDSKQVEYNVLMNEKDDEVELLLKEIEKLKEERIEKDKIIEEKDKILSKVATENEFVKLKAQYKNQKSESEKRDEKEMNEKIEQKNQLKTKAMKKSVNNTINKLKKNFDMGNDDNVNFVKNIQSKIK
jgi:hypothetical protein